MLVVIDRTGNKTSSGIPMYSRAGKSTANQYLAFSSHANSKSKKITNKRKLRKRMDEEDKALFELLEYEEMNLQKIIDENSAK